MEVVVTTGAVRRAKLQSNRHHQHNKPTPNCVQTGCPSCRPTNNVNALNGNTSLLLFVLEYCFEQLVQEAPPYECDDYHDDIQTSSLTSLFNINCRLIMKY